MNATTNYAAKYTAAAMDAYVKYAETKDARDADYLLRRAHHYEVLAETARESAQRDAVKVEAAQPVPVAKVEAPKVEAQPAPCNVKVIRRFFAIARENGLDTSQAAKPAMRHAMETAMKRCVNSRSEVSADEWRMMGDLIKAGRLAW
jgi:hypothetical protein